MMLDAQKKSNTPYDTHHINKTVMRGTLCWRGFFANPTSIVQASEEHKMDITGKRALVVGGSRGIGLAVARALADQGARLALPWFDWPDSAVAMAKEFGAREGGHFAIQIDLRQPAEVATLMQAITVQFGGLGTRRLG